MSCPNCEGEMVERNKFPPEPTSNPVYVCKNCGTKTDGVTLTKE